VRELIKRSMECKWRKHQLKIYVVIWLVVIVATLFISMFGFLSSGMQKEDFKTAVFVFGVLVGVWSIAFLPIIIFYLYQYNKLFKNCEGYELCETVLDRPSTSYWYRGAVYYTVTFQSKSSGSVTLDTRPLWSSAVLADFQLSEYNNKKIDVLYDKENERVIVIGFREGRE